MEPALKIIKKWIERQNKLKARKMRKIIKSEDQVIDVDVVASLTEKLRNAERELTKEKLRS